jgi:hypothetical protein
LRFGASSLICGISIGKVKIVANLALLEQVEHILAVVVGRRGLGQPFVDHLLVERGRLDRRLAVQPAGTVLVQDVAAVGPERVVEVGVGLDLLALQAEGEGVGEFGDLLARRLVELVPRGGRGDASLLVECRC